MERLSFREIVKKQKLTYKELGEILHKAKPTIQTYMNGRTDPDIDSYIKIAKHLDIPLDELIGLTTDKVSIPKEEYDELIRIRDSLNKIIK